MSRDALGRSPWLAAAPWLLAACGSRTPLLLEPGEDTLVDAAVSTPITPATLQDAAAPPLGCIMGTRPVREVHIDLFFTLDKSRSMRSTDPGSTKTRWDSVSSALDSFINAPLSQGLGAGISFFPRVSPSGTDLCSAADYTFPVVPIGTLPGVAPSILTSISFQILSTGTPMTPALEGAHVYALKYVGEHPDHTVAVVIVTDGAPHDCGSTIPGTAAKAAAAVAQIPSITTYVLGVGPNLANLNAIALAGGTSQAYLAETGGESALLAQLEAIRTSALACEYVFPPGSTTNFEVAVITTYDGSDAGTTSVDRVAGPAACGGGRGWFYDNEPSAGGPLPTRVTLCPASCAPLVKGTGSHLDVRVGCPAPNP